MNIQPKKLANNAKAYYNNVFNIISSKKLKMLIKECSSQEKTRSNKEKIYALHT